MRSRAFVAKSVVIAAALAATAVVPAAQGVPLPARDGAAVVGAQTVGDTLFPHQGNGGYDVEHYDLAIAWSMGNTINATTTITATTTDAPLSQFSLDLEGLTVTSVKVDGVDATFTREATGAKHKLVITPATPVEGVFAVTVAYNGTPVTHTDPDGSKEGWVSTPDGAVALNEPVGAMTWFPNNNTPRDKATFTTRLTVPYNPVLPAGNRIGASTGVLASTSTTDATRTFVWEQPNKQATYLALVGIGQYTQVTADVPLTSGTTKEWSYSDPGAAGSVQLSTSRDKLSPMLKDLEKYYGTYPGASTGLVLDVSSLGYALETQDRPYFENNIAESTLIHELAHQWFGNAVSPTDWSDLWLNEGPATYLATQVAHNLYGKTSTQDAYYKIWNDSTNTSAMWVTPGAGFTDATKLFGAQVYTRGAVVLEALRSALGDSVHTEIMSTWIERYAGSDASTAEFIALAEEISRRDLDAFFQDWLYDTDKPAAWPVAYELSLASAPVTGSSVDAGSRVDWTLTAQNSGKVPTGVSVVTVDVADVVAAGTLDTLPAGVTRDGDTLEWAVPNTAVGASATVTIGATLEQPGQVDVTARGRTLGADCGQCASTVTVRPRVISPAPAPSITGTARVGSLLTGVRGSWDPAAALSYRWLRDGVPVPGASGTSHRLTVEDLGEPITFEVTGTRAGHEDAVRTAVTAPVARGLQARRPVPELRGVARVGRLLTARPGVHDAGVRVAYRWHVGGRPVAGAAQSTFRLVRAHVGKRVRVVTIASKPGYVDVVKASDRRPVVRRR